MRFSALLPALSLSLLSAGHSLDYRAAEELSLRITSSQVAELSLLNEEVTVLVNGEEQELGERPDLEVTLHFTENIEFVDTIRSSAEDSVPNKFERKFETLGSVLDQDIVGLPEGAEAPEAREYGSELEGQSAVYEWDAEEEAWSVSASEDADFDEDLLELLEQNSDFTYFLPGKEVELGDTWDLDVDVVRRILNVIGDIEMRPIDEDEPKEDDDLEKEWSADQVSAELTGVEDEIATIHIVIDATRIEQGELAPPQMPDSDMEPPTITLEDTLSWQGEGDLLWSLADHRPVSILIEGTVTRDYQRTREMEGPMGSIKIEELRTFAGQFTTKIEVAENGKDE